MVHQDDESLILDFKSVGQHISQNLTWIAALTLGAMLLAGVYGFLIHQPVYQSEATILFNSANNTPTVVSDISDISSLLNSDNIRINPFKSQEQLLHSKLLAEKVIDDLRAEGWKVNRKPQVFMKEVLGASHLRETDFIRLYAKSSKPADSQKIAETYLTNYQELMMELSYNPLKEKKALFENQILETEIELDSLKDNIQAYQETHGIIDIRTENQLKVRRLEDIEGGIKNTEAQLSQTNAEVTSILGQLKLKPSQINTAIQSVARGQNSILTALYSRLYEKQKLVDEKSQVFAPTNPELIRLKKDLLDLQKQIDGHNVLTMGKVNSDDSLLIKDGLRMDMVNRLVKNKAEQSALSNKLGTLQRQKQNLSGELKTLPKSQLDYARLRSQLDNKQKLMERLQDKLSEIKIHMAGIQKNLVVIDPPSLPESTASLSPIQLILGAGLATLFVSVLGLTFVGFVKNNQLPADMIEALFDAPVLSIIPTALKKGKSAFSKSKLKNSLSHVVESYQNLAVNLKVQGELTHKNVLTVSALGAKGEQSEILSNLGLCLAQAGESTVLIDANLRQPELHEVFDHALNYEKGMVEVINNVSEHLFKNGGDTSTLRPIVEKGLTPSGIHQGLFYLNAGFALDNPFEFLNSKGLHQLIASLKENFDCVMVNAPPLSNNPEVSAVLRHTDGLLLLTDDDISEAKAKEVHQRITKLNSSVVGLVVQEKA